MAWALSTFESKGETLRYGVYTKPGAFEITKYLLFLPGRGEYIEKYNYLPELLNLDKNTALLIVDHRGQGFSSGERFHVLSYDEFCSDIKNLLDKLKIKEPYSLVAFSMGGLVSLYGTLKGFFSPKKMFLVCPLLGLAKTRVWYLNVFSLSGILTFLGFGKKRWRKYRVADRFEDNLLTANPLHYESLKKSPCPPEEASFAWIFATLRAIFYVTKIANLRKMKAHLLFCAVAQEQIVSNVAIYNFMKKMFFNSSQNTASFFLFQGKHELFFEKEIERERFLNLLNTWIEDA
jgi:lysophospholipase